MALTVLVLTLADTVQAVTVMSTVVDRPMRQYHSSGMALPVLVLTL